MTQNGEDTTPARPSGIPELRLATEGPEPPPPHERPPQAQHLPRDHSQAILEAAKQVGALLKREGHSFALAGSVAVYAHGGSEYLQHDVDFAIRPEDAEAVAASFGDAGLTVSRPPEDWLLKTKCFGQDVDIIFELAHQPVTTDMLARAQNIPVDSVHMPVLDPTDLVRSRIAAFSEHHCDFGAVLPVARALRERVDWEEVRRTCGDEPMPAAFLFLLERLKVIAPQEEHP
ncbi:hypothetical protein [Streptomyces sp. HUAS ZL42]|uniref:hypothetical protein n=1 Tax=Streptomyces sp. HUAS ZL42 TaxID=3231715 RepID=UPI00345F0551